MNTCAATAPVPKDARGLTPLHRAAALGDAATVRDLLARGADPAVLDSRMGASPLHHAAQSGCVEVGRTLLGAGAFLNLQAPTHGVTPLMSAVWYRHPAFVAFLLDRPGINVELRSCFGATAERLIGYGSRPDDGSAQRQNDGLRALFAAYREGRDRTLAARAGAPVDAVSPVMSSGDDGHTPLLVAARDGDTTAVAALLAAGADQTIADHYMAATPAHKAAYGGHSDVLRLLARAPGFDAVRDAQGPFNGYTPLHDAVWHGHRDAAEVLLRAGARTDVAALDGHTPGALARLHGYPELAELLTPAPLR